MFLKIQRVFLIAVKNVSLLFGSQPQIWGKENKKSGSSLSMSTQTLLFIVLAICYQDFLKKYSAAICSL